MMPLTERLRVNSDEVAGEVVDSEVILINFGTGMYYTMSNVGLAVWQLLERRHSLEEMGTIIAERYGVEIETVLRDLETVIGRLIEARLIVADGGAASPDPVALAELGNGESYSEPTLHTYTDMAEIFALDPPLPVLKDSWQKPN